MFTMKNVFDRFGVGLELVVPAVSRDQRGSADVHAACRAAVAEVRQSAGERGDDADFLLILHLLHRVTLNDVTDLVSEHAGKLIGAIVDSISPRLT